MSSLEVAACALLVAWIGFVCGVGACWSVVTSSLGALVRAFPFPHLLPLLVAWFLVCFLQRLLASYMLVCPFIGYASGAA
eukprot:283499-Amphidinium_carterae.2